MNWIQWGWFPINNAPTGKLRHAKSSLRRSTSFNQCSGAKCQPTIKTTTFWSQLCTFIQLDSLFCYRRIFIYYIKIFWLKLWHDLDTNIYKNGNLGRKETKMNILLLMVVNMTTLTSIRTNFFTQNRPIKPPLLKQTMIKITPYSMVIFLPKGGKRWEFFFIIFFLPRISYSSLSTNKID